MTKSEKSKNDLLLLENYYNYSVFQNGPKLKFSTSKKALKLILTNFIAHKRVEDCLVSEGNILRSIYSNKNGLGRS